MSGTSRFAHAARYIAALLAPAGLFVAGGSSMAGASPQPYDSAQAIISRVLPGASTSMRTAPAPIPGAPRARTLPTAPAKDLLITLPARTAPPAASQTMQEFAYADIQWRAQLGTAAAALSDPAIGSYSIQYADGSVPSLAGNYFSDSIPRPGPAALPDPSIDKLPQSDAVAQAKSNVSALAKVLPRDAIAGSTVKAIPIAPDANRYAISVVVDLTSGSALSGHLGDALKGLETGLISGSDVMIEGISITVSAQGKPLAGSWESIRAGAGGLQFAPTIHPGSSLAPTTTFPNLTGLTAPATSVLGGPAAKPRHPSTAGPGVGSSGQPAGGPGAGSPGRQVPNHDPATTVTNTKHSRTNPWEYAAISLAALVALAAGIGIWRHKQRGQVSPEAGPQPRRPVQGSTGSG